MVDADVGLLDDFRVQFEFVVVAGGTLEIDTDLRHGKQNVLFFEFAVTDPVEAEELGAAHFEEREVVGVMEVAHGVAFDIAHAEVEEGFVDNGGRVRHADTCGGLTDTEQLFARLIVEQQGEFIGVDGVAEALDAIHEDDRDVVAVFFEEVEVLGDVDFFDEDGDVLADDFLDGVEGDLAEVAAGLGHDGDLVHEVPL
jgi:hypothetical protein